DLLSLIRKDRLHKMIYTLLEMAAVAACSQAGCAAETPAGDPNPPRRNPFQTLSTDYEVEVSPIEPEIWRH
ncbi:MAG: hypothetical protein ACYDBH_13520, partial [Acidobacteriaceae bacterium]